MGKWVFINSVLVYNCSVMWQQLWLQLVRFGFRLLYYEMAWTYDLVSWLVSLGAWRDWQRAALPFVTGTQVLEVGHGPGHLLPLLAAQGCQVVGVDLSPYMGRLARRRVGSVAAVSLVRANVARLPWPTAVFDTVLSTFPTNYIVTPATLTAVYRVLKPHGRLVIVPEGHLTRSGVVTRLIEWLYTITGQRSVPFDVDEAAWWHRFKRPFLEAGFHVTLHPIQLEGSAVTVVVATKADD